VVIEGRVGSSVLGWECLFFLFLHIPPAAFKEAEFYSVVDVERVVRSALTENA
jgi:hypothetical protein